MVVSTMTGIRLKFVQFAHSRVSWQVSLVIVVCVLGLAEATARLVVSYMPPYEAGYEREFLVKAEQLRDLEAPLDLVFVGASMVDSGIDPQLVNANTDWVDTSYNAGGIPIRNLNAWTNNIVVPLANPSAIVVAIHPLELGIVRDEDMRTYQQVTDTVATTLMKIRPRGLERVEVEASKYLFLVRERGRLQDIPALTDSIVNLLHQRRPERQTSSDGDDWEALVSPLGTNLRYSEAPSAALRDAAMASRLEHIFDLGIDMALIDKVMGEFGRSKIQVILLIPPIDIGTLSLDGLSPERFDEAAEVLRKAAERSGIPIIDLAGASYDSLLFHDKLHLAEAGRVRMSLEVASALDELCVTSPGSYCNAD